MDIPFQFEFENEFFSHHFATIKASYEHYSYSWEKPSVGWRKKTNNNSILMIPGKGPNNMCPVFKCFTSNHGTWDMKFKTIKEELDGIKSPYLIPFEIHENELLIDAPGCDKKSFTVYTTEWGYEWKTLNNYVIKKSDTASYFYDKSIIPKLSSLFSQLAIWLLKQPFAHGSICPENILVSNDGNRLFLVNYDNMFFPSMISQSYYDEKSHNGHIDDLPLIVISLALRASVLVPDQGRGLINSLFKYGLRNLHKTNDFKLLYSLIKDPIICQLLTAYNLVKSNIPVTEDLIYLFEVTEQAPLSCNYISLPADNHFIYEDVSNPKEDATKKATDDKEEIEKWCRKAADLGDQESQYRLGMYFFEKFYYGSAKTYFQKAAASGNNEAKGYWAYCQALLTYDKFESCIYGPYDHSRKLLQEYKDWLILAANNGCSNAQIEIAQRCRDENDLKNHYKWTYMAATQHDDCESQYFLGVCYLFGKGVEKNHSAAFEWFKKAADKNNVDALNALGYCYAKGIGTTVDYYKAADCFRQIISISFHSHSNPEKAYYNLGRCYELGYGVEKNNDLAETCYRKAEDCVPLEKRGVYFSDIERVGGFVDWDELTNEYEYYGIHYDGSDYVYRFFYEFKINL